MIAIFLLGLALTAPMPADATFPLRTDPPPKEWRAEEINSGLPYWWERGSVHLLAWEVIADDRPFKVTQILVLKRFDRPTEDGGHRWVLAKMYRDPDDPEQPWRTQMHIPPPLPKNEPMPELTDAELYQYEFYGDPPTDKQIEIFLRQTDWTPTLGTYRDSVPRVTAWLAAGGVDPAVWKKALGRDVPTRLFPELRKPAADKKGKTQS